MARLGLTFSFVHLVSLPDYLDLAGERESRDDAIAWMGEAVAAPLPALLRILRAFP